MPVNFELQWNGPSVMEAFDRRALAAMQKAGIEGERVAQANARVRTGFMRDSVYVIVQPLSAHFDAGVQRFRNAASGQFVAGANVGPSGAGWTLIVGDAAPYAVFNELGTVFMSAQPFVRPGGDHAAQMLLGLLAEST